MKSILILLFISFTTICKADFIDKVDIFVNGKLIQINGKQICLNSLHVGDTILFYAETDWDLLLHATIEIKNTEGKSTILRRIQNNKVGANFQIIVTEELLKEELVLWLNYNSKKVEPWQFLTLKYGC